jgi:hypothetical protein
MSAPKSRIRHKHYRLDSNKISRAQKVLLMRRMDSLAESSSSIGTGESVGTSNGSAVGGRESAQAWIIASGPGIPRIRESSRNRISTPMT